MKIVSFNLRFDTPDDREQQFIHRLPYILDRIREEKPDIIGFQEALQSMREALRDGLEEYYIVGGGRDADRFGESSVIAFRKTRYNLNECDTFWLSPTPYVPGSRFPEDQSEYPRACTMISLTETHTGKTFAVYNLHTDHIGAIARRRSSEELIARIKADTARRALPFVMTGDFNAEPFTGEIKLLKAAGMRDLAEGCGRTFHGFGRFGRVQGSEEGKIDYIFASEGVNAKGCRLWTEKRGGLYLSDHYPVEAEVEL